MRDSARVHPATVTAVSTGAVASPRRPRRKVERPPLVEVTSLVDPDTLALAKHLAGGDVSRLRFNGDGSVTVTN